MKKLIFVFLMLVCTSLRAQTSILTYPTNTPALTDRFYLVIPPGGAANQRSPSLQDIFNGAGLNLTAEATPVAGDYVILYDVSTSTARRVLCSDLTKALTAASATLQGVVTTGTQTLAGKKTINNQVIASRGTAVYNLVEADTAHALISSTENVIGSSHVDAVQNNTAANMNTNGSTVTFQGFDWNTSLWMATVLRGSTINIQTTTGQVVINDNGLDLDTRIESDTDANNFYSDAGANRIGIGTATPGQKLDVVGTTATTSLIVGGGGTISGVLTNTATLDFPSTLVSTISDLTITVTGAALGDTVSIGVPNDAITATGSYFGWVSATNTVTIRFMHVAAGSEDPGSGTFRATVTKF